MHKQQNQSQEKNAFGRLRVLTAPPTSVHELVASETASPRDADASPFSFEIKGEPRRTVLTSTGAATTVSSGRRTNLRPSSGTGSSQRLSGCNRDHSVTQFALIDDENVSALQQVTRGGGALTLASQWKSQFDDSEETTDNEWKQEPQSPEHKEKTQQQINKKKLDLKKKRCHLNIAGIENYTNLEILPNCWSEPTLGNVIRSNLEPPLLQQAAFDDKFYRMDIIRNVGVREQESDTGANTEFPLTKNLRLKRNSLPNITFNETQCIEQEQMTKCSAKEKVNSSICEYQTLVADPNNEEECAVSGRLEIRVVPQG